MLPPRDLERSIELMPTAPAYYTLGKIAEGRGDIDTAIEHYRMVAKAGGEYGSAAAGELARIELPRNPSAYVKHRCDADANGNLIVSVQNQAGIPVAGVRIAVQYTDNYGRTQQLVKAINGQIASGQIANVNTGLGGYTGASCPVTVIAAQVVQ